MILQYTYGTQNTLLFQKNVQHISPFLFPQQYIPWLFGQKENDETKPVEL